MNTYTQYLKVSKSDLDDLNHVNNVTYLQWAQDIAKTHWETEASDAIKAEYIWVAIHHDITYKNPAFLNDEVEVTTYILNSEGPTSTRVVKMHSKVDHKLLVITKTKWCLLDAKTNKPKRIPAHIKDLFL